MQKVLVPRRIEGRQEKHIQIDLQRINDYVEKCKSYDENNDINWPDWNLNLTKSSLTKLPYNLTHVYCVLEIQRSKINDLNNLIFCKKICVDFKNVFNLKFKKELVIKNFIIADIPKLNEYELCSIRNFLKDKLDTIIDTIY